MFCPESIYVIFYNLIEEMETNLFFFPQLELNKS